MVRTGEFPARELAAELGEIGFLGMQLQGEHRGRNPVAYGLVELELEAGDRSPLVRLVQSALAMYAMDAFGSDEQKPSGSPGWRRAKRWMLGLSEPDTGSDPRSMRTGAPSGTEMSGCSGTKMWIINGSVSDVAIVWANTDDGTRGFAVPSDLQDSARPTSTRRCRSARP